MTPHIFCSFLFIKALKLKKEEVLSAKYHQNNTRTFIQNIKKSQHINYIIENGVLKLDDHSKNYFYP